MRRVFSGCRPDTPEMMAKCFNCTEPDCYDCLGGGDPDSLKYCVAGKEMTRGRRQIEYGELRKLYKTCKELNDGGMPFGEIAEVLGLNYHTLAYRMTKYRKLCDEKGVDAAEYVDFKKTGRPTKWTPEKLKRHYEEIQMWRSAGYTWAQIGEHYGTTAPVVWNRCKAYERMIGEGK